MSVQYSQSGGVAELTLDRGDAANSITIGMAVDVRAAVQQFIDSDAKVLIVTGQGPKSFCAGGAIETLDRCADSTQAAEVGPLGFARIDPGKPTIAAVNGHCFGGGLELALWCDVRIAATNASFGALNRPWGVPLIDGGTQRLPRIVGYGNAMWMILGGHRVDADTALRIGLVQEVVSAGQALTRAREFARQVAEYPQRALLADRRGVTDSVSLPIAHGLAAEFERGAPIVKDEDVVQRIHSTKD
jgi:enoyl-CoA hydratase